MKEWRRVYKAGCTIRDVVMPYSSMAIPVKLGTDVLKVDSWYLTISLTFAYNAAIKNFNIPLRKAILSSVLNSLIVKSPNCS